jgi:hypothetical protein
VAGAAADDFYSGDDGLLLHYDGSEWAACPLPSGIQRVNDVFGLAGGELMILDYSRFHRFNGETWDYIGLPSSDRSVCVLPSGEVFVASYDGSVWFHDGDVWSVDSVPDVSSPTALHAVSADDACLVGNGGLLGGGGRISHFDGVSWTTAAVDSYHFHDVWRTSDRRTFVIESSDRVLEYAGGAFNRVALPADFRAERFFGSGRDVYVHGRGPSGYEVKHHDGTGWTSTPVGTREYVSDAWLAPSGEALLAAYDGLWRAQGATSERILGQPDPYHSYNVLWVSPDGEVFAVGRTALRWDGNEWIDLHKEELTDASVYAVHGTSRDNVYAVGDRMILHYDGTAWDWVSGGFGSTLGGVWVSGDVVIAVGESGTIVRARGGIWEKMPAPTERFLDAVSGWDGGAVAVGEAGTILRYDGSSWTPEASPVTWHLYDVLAFGPDAMVAVGDNPWYVLIRDGKGWSPRIIESYHGGQSFDQSIAVSGTSPANFYVAQYYGNIHHYDGRTWKDLPRCAVVELTDVAATPKGDLFVASSRAVLRYQRSR